ncbi:hypothetical protein IFR05_012007 [Cadophora sp. M221]|nr:hypothetical protein IFR05_012007 [Cadophora sp. M221]
MAADLLIEGKAGKDFMKSSVMIEIKCIDNITDEDVIVRIPEAIACSLSGWISKLVGTGIDVQQEITGGNVQYSELKEQLGNGTVLDYLTWFVQWMYTSKLDYKQDLRFFGMWIFASKIECPRFQNAAVRILCRDAPWRSNVSLEEKKKQSKNNGEIDNSYWENKKRLLFLLDCAAYFGPGDRRLSGLLHANEVLLVQMMKRMVDLAKEGAEICPWDPKNIARYFVAEANFDDALKEETASQTPLRKRRLYSSNMSVANDSHKRIRSAPERGAIANVDVPFEMTYLLSSSEDDDQVAT